ncbi:MAG TPA: FAD-binding oxidoreductase [Flavipsychrobacter sp.]|nr:FAD-binding oxidoreductase [Flavipsychrobacter sp.]
MPGYANTMSLRQACSLFAAVCGQAYVSMDNDLLSMYETDQSCLRFPLDVLVKPATSAEVAQVIAICNEHDIPVTPRGGGSGVVGGALPVYRGVVLSLERLNTIIEINTAEKYVVAEAGVITADLCSALEQHGLCLPVTPGSSDISCIGGNVATNAGSMYSCRYGQTANMVLNLEVVLPNGDIIWTASNVKKRSAGLNLNQLFTGSEGILGIITKVMYRVAVQPAHEICLLAGFNHLRTACEAVNEINRSGLQPSAVEIIGEQALNITALYLNESLPLIQKDITTHLLIEFTAYSTEEMDSFLENIYALLSGYAATDILLASSAAEKFRLRRLRSSIGGAMTANGRQYRDIDACIPVAHLNNYLSAVQEITSSTALTPICFGHALDGNIHTMLLSGQGELAHDQDIDNITNEIFQYATQLGGVISGEHGIGLLHKTYLPLQFSTAQLNLMKTIKHALDQKNILNPGKLLP